MRFVRRYAITIITTVVLGVVGILIYRNSLPPPEAADAGKFTPSTSLEVVVNATSGANHATALIGWENGDTLGFPMKLRWSKPDRGAMHAVTIYDNRGNMVWSGASTDTTIAVERSLDAGLFYMMLEVDGVLRQMRRFVVLR